MSRKRCSIKDPEAIEAYKEMMLWIADSEVSINSFRNHGIAKSVLMNWLAGKCMPTGWNFKKLWKACFVKECPFVLRKGRDYFNHLPDKDY